MDFFERVGRMAIGSRLRRLSEIFTEDARNIYALYGVPQDPKWFPVFYVLSHAEEGLSTKEIAEQIGHSHASVSQIVKAMTGAGLVVSRKSRSDGRVNAITLSQKGRATLPILKPAYADVTATVEELLDECHTDLWHALGEIELALEERDLFSRVKKKYRERQRDRVRIIDFEPHHARLFAELNYEWIEQYFEVEDPDRQKLDNPQAEIIAPGGAILMAELDGDIVGTCALIKMDDDRYELSKMAVSPRAQGLGIGWLLGVAVIERARRLGGRTVFLESNTILGPAIALYRKLGFQRVAGPKSRYARCNIQMELDLEEAPEVRSA